MSMEPKAFQIWKIVTSSQRGIYSRNAKLDLEITILVLGYPRNFTTLSCSRVLAGEPVKIGDYKLRDGLIASAKEPLKVALGKIEFFALSAFKEFVAELSYEEIQEVHDLLVKSAR